MLNNNRPYPRMHHMSNVSSYLKKEGGQILKKNMEK